MFNKHLISAAASLSVTLALFTGIEAYAANLAHTPLPAAVTQSQTKAPFEIELQQALENSRRELKDNVAAVAIADLPAFQIAGAQQLAQR